MRRVTVWFVLLLAAWLLAGCALAPARPVSQPQVVAIPAGNQPDGPTPVPIFEVLIARLRAAGAEVEVGGGAAHPMITGSLASHHLRVNGQVVKVFEYADANAALLQTVALAPMGAGPVHSKELPKWGGSPHLFRHANLLVLYVGTDPGVRGLLLTTIGGHVLGS